MSVRLCECDVQPLNEAGMRAIYSAHPVFELQQSHAMHKGLLAADVDVNYIRLRQM